MSTAHRAWGVGGGLLAVVIAAATACSADVHPAAPSAAAPASSAAASSSAVAAPVAAPSATPAPTAAPSTTPSPTTGKYIAPPLSAEQATRTRAELAALAARLPAHLRLTPPATWAQYAGTTPEYAEDVVSCPHVAATLDAELGQKWTYAFGKLPQGPAGCNWTPVPWVPDRPVADRLFVTLGYQAGAPAELLAAPGYCAGGVTAPVLAVPAVGSGAVVDGCLDDDGTQLELDVADPAGTGVWTVSTYAGQAQSTARAADSLLALISAVRRVYG